MKLSCLQENLSKALNITSRIISTRVNLPVLGNILINTEKGRLKLSSTNLEIGLTYIIGSKIEKEGNLTIPARLFTDYINSLPSGKVNLNMTGDDLNLESGKYKATIKGIPASEFPLIPKVEGKPILTLPSKILSEAISLVSFASAIDDSRPVLSGVLLYFTSNKLKIVATDSYRLSEKIIQLKEKVKEEKKIIVPCRTMQELGRIISEEEVDIEIYIGENQILFKMGDIELTSRLIEGNFPSYEQIIPDSWQTKAVVSTSELTNIVKIASLFARETAGSLKLVLKDNELEVLAATNQVGQTDLVIETKTEGPPLEISFNAKYLLDLLSNLKSKQISLEFSGKVSPGMFKPTPSQEFTHIIMPLKS